MKIFAMGIVSLCILSSAALGQLPLPDEVLDHMEAVMGGFSDLEARLSIVHFREGQPDLQQEVKLYLLQQDKLRLEYLSPDYLAGNVSLAVGDSFWVYIAAADTWYEKDLSELSPSQQPWIMFRALLRSVRSEYREYSYQVKADGGLLLLTGTPTEEGAVYGRIELWVDPENWLPVRRKLYDVDGKFLAEARFLQHTEVAPGMWLPLKVEVYDEEGKLVSEVSYLEVKVDVGVPESLFAPPEGSGGSGG
jgi:outer membrane lipoprotein-sorting protein